MTPDPCTVTVCPDCGRTDGPAYFTDPRRITGQALCRWCRLKRRLWNRIGRTP